jgi:hypothetical protein
MSNGTPASTPGKEPKPPQKDIQGMAFPVLEQPEQPPELKELYLAVVSKGRDAMSWYSRQMVGKRRWGQWLRMMAILLTALASITPIIVHFMPGEPRYQQWSLLASLFAVLGATCVGLDNYFGASAGWMRYVSAYQELNSRLEALQFGWVRLALASSGSSKEQRLSALMDLLQGFIIGVNEVVRQETQDWMAEFKGHMAVLEQRMEAQRTALAISPSMVYGAIKVLTEGSEKLKDGRWKVMLGTGRELSGTWGQAVVATSLTPGLLAVRIEAVLKDGRPFVTEDVTTIKSGEVTTHVFLVP